MEEWIGSLWHRWISRAAGGHHPAAAVTLKSLARPLAIYFRALGGDSGLRLAAAATSEHQHRRSWLARVAGSGSQWQLACRDSSTLRLPPQIDAFPDPALNRDLYYWLAAQAALLDAAPAEADEPLALRRNQQASRDALARWPGLRPRYQRLVAACLSQRPDPASLPPDEAAREAALRQALYEPGSVSALPLCSHKAPPQPVLLWLQPEQQRPLRTARSGNGDQATAAEGSTLTDARDQAHRAEQVQAPKEKHGLLLPFRAESLLAVAEFLRLNRSVDDDPDPQAVAAARDLEQLALTTPDPGERQASRVRFDLDLPSAAADDLPLGPGLRLPEWDYRRGELLEDHVCLQELTPREAPPQALPAHLRRTARRLQRQFAALQPDRQWLKGQRDGSELDLDALVRARTDREAGLHPGEQLYLSLEQRQRNLACLVLADLSLSTDAWVSNEARVIDVIRDALLLFGETLAHTGDRFALCGFSSVRRQQVRFHRLKDFAAPFNDQARGRIQAIKPGFYTRMGAAIRHASHLLAAEAASQRVLLILSDGKPNDLDLYDSRYGIEDTRAAIHEARRQGLQAFCLTIDREGEAYLPHLFGLGGYAVLRNPVELPAHLPTLYARLTRGG